MKILPLLVLLLSTLTSAYVVQTFSNLDCTGHVQRVNVRDSSCAKGMDNYRSIRVRKFGGRRQKARFCGKGDCISRCTAFMAVSLPSMSTMFCSRIVVFM